MTGASTSDSSENEARYEVNNNRSRRLRPHRNNQRSPHKLVSGGRQIQNPLEANPETAPTQPSAAGSTSHLACSSRLQPDQTLQRDSGPGKSIAGGSDSGPGKSIAGGSFPGNHAAKALLKSSTSNIDFISPLSPRGDKAETYAIKTSATSTPDVRLPHAQQPMSTGLPFPSTLSTPPSRTRTHTSRPTPDNPSTRTFRNKSMDYSDGCGPSSTPSSSSQESSSGSSQSGMPVDDDRQVLVETITAVRMPMLQPNPWLLHVIKSAGGTGDVFSMRQIISHVKDYIGERLLYDVADPRIVYCDGLLAKALGVQRFTILEAISLFQRNCTTTQDSVLQLDRQVEVRPEERPAAAKHEDPSRRRCDERVGCPAQESEAETMCVSHSSGKSTANSDTSVVSAPVSAKLDTDRLSASALSNDNDAAQMNSSKIFYPSQTSCLSSSLDIGPSSSQTTTQESSQTFSLSHPSSAHSSHPSTSSSSSSTVVNIAAAKSSVTFSEHDLLKSPQDHQMSADSLSDTGHHKDKPSRCSNRSRRASVSMSFDEPDGDTGGFTVSVECAQGDNQQDNEGTVVLEYESDTFSVEYEIASSSGGEDDEQVNQGSRSRTVSEVSSSSSGPATQTAMLVVCQESDVEYLADYSDTDTGSDAELSDADKWQCRYCGVKNPPFQRNCAGCWGVRSNWLPVGTAAGVTSGTSESGASIQRCEDGASTAKFENIAEESGNNGALSRFAESGMDLGASGGITTPGTEEKNNASCGTGYRVGSSTAFDGNNMCVAAVSESGGSPGVDNVGGEKAGKDSTDGGRLGTKFICVDNKVSCKDGGASGEHVHKSDVNINGGHAESDSKGRDLKKVGEDFDTSASDKSLSPGNNPDHHRSKARSGKQRGALFEKTEKAGHVPRSEACVVCLTRRKTASIIHGKTGHQVCCYRCACKLKKQRRACPICRKPIQKVIRNYHL